MNHIHGVFPFGLPVTNVEQSDRKPKKVFVLGVYASAVHARWSGPDEKTIVQALAVASEPRIFWEGNCDEAKEIIRRIEIPSSVGKLEPADSRFNGPSALALDDQILKPLCLSRADAWLCDLVPHSCMNPSQKKAIDDHYVPIAKRYKLPTPSVPCVPTKLADDERRREIMAEIRQSKANILITLGDQPLKWFVRCGGKHRLAEWQYGCLSPVAIDNLTLTLLPLAHPRQIAKLGRSSPEWFEKHARWEEHTAPSIKVSAG